MTWRRRLHELGVLLIAAIGMGASCDEVPPDVSPSIAQPLPQESTVLVEVDVPNVGWVTMPVPQEGAERLARLWCWHDRMKTTDSRLCGSATVGNRNPLNDLDPASVANAPLPTCQAELCRLRNEVCAGMLLEEAARSPLPRTLESSTAGAPFLFLDLLQIPENARLTALAKAAAPQSIRRTTKIRFKPMQAPSRAAALRGALNRYREAGFIGEALTASDTRVASATCADRFAPLPGEPAPPAPLLPDADGVTPTWADVLFMSITDAANQYSGALYRTVDAMRDSAQAGVKGANAELNEVATQWNGSVDSATAIANLLAYGQPAGELVGAQQAMALPTSCGDEHKASDIGPTGVPVCPPIGEDEGVKNVLEQSRQMQYKPFSLDAVATFTLAKNAFWMQSGAIQTPLPQQQVLQKANVTTENILKAAAYQCAQAQLTGTAMLPAGTVGSGGAIAPVFTGTAKPAGTLPSGAMASHFSGAVGAAAAQQVGTRSYSASGAIRVLDAFKKTTTKLSAHPAAAGVQPKLTAALDSVAKGLETETGGRRLEFVLGHSTSPPEGLAVDQLAVIIHGVPANASNPAQAGEKYQLVQGVKGLKCVLNGSIDGAACDPSHYAIDLNAVAAYSTTADSRMTDLSGGYLSALLTSIPQKDSPAHPITVEHTVYVIRTADGAPAAFGGVVPMPGTLNLPGAPESSWPTGISATRAVITPAGGTLEQVLQNAVTPNSDDCSKALTTCAGLPSDLWPPLESEIVGEPSGQPFEQSWKHYLGLAKDAAAEADRLGEELLGQGLQMDLRREEMQAKLEELCGADIASCGIGSNGQPDPLVWVTLGDKDACLWEIDGVVCNRQAAKDPPCPIVLNPDEVADATTCGTKFDKYAELKNKATAVPARALGLVKTSAQTTNPGACAAFSALRLGSGPELDAADPIAKKRKREDYIRNFIFNDFGFERFVQLAKNLRYSEGFADNYKLTVNDEAVVFDTKRPKPGAPNGSLSAPCVIVDADTSTGSKFWTDPGVECVLSVPTPCSDHDGCTTPAPTMFNATLDTEPQALRNRWSWGFGHLRRAVATLGVITGELNSDMMTLARIFTRAKFNPFPSLGDALYNNSGGAYVTIGNPPPLEPLWVMHGTPGGNQAYKNHAACLHLFDPQREDRGRPVNFNGFLPNALPLQSDSYDFIAAGTGDGFLVDDFPILLSLTGTRAPGGLDPQMPYCHLAPPSQYTAVINGGFSNFTSADWAVNVGGGVKKTSGYVGSYVAKVAAVRKYGAPWSNAVAEMWQTPQVGEAFCDDAEPSPKSAVWRALCFAPGTDAPLASNTDFQRLGKLPNPGNIFFADEKKVGGWLSPVTPGEKTRYGQMLFDLRKGSPASQAVPFQYPLSQRNIFDALELACHAQARAATGTPVKCEGLDVDSLPTTDLEVFSGALTCLSKQAGSAAERFSVGPIPKSVLDAFSKKGALPSTTGLGGEYLQAMGRQQQALIRAAEDYAKIQDATAQLSVAFRKMKSIAEEDEALDEAAVASKYAATFQGMAAALSSLAQASDPKNLFGSNVAHMGAAAAHFAAAQFQCQAIAATHKAQEAGQEQKRLDVVASMVSNIGAAREAANDFALALNDLNQATADLKLIQKKAAKATAGMTFADYANSPDGKKDPQFVNVVMRRMFNTKLLRYEKAFERAKRLAYLSRRAIELRFGVDLQRLDQPMTLVDAPSKWANDICDLQGIDYSEIREPNPDQPVKGTTPGAKPLPGDDFAHAYVGDYVTKLEDFVNSYPIDYPLKDGDDTAVLSLADDIFNVSASCTKPGRNLLFFSTELNKSDSFEPPSKDTQGWYVRDCGLSLPSSGGAPAEEWRGCIGVIPEVLNVGNATFGLPRTGLPKEGLPYRLRNERCIQVTGAEGQSTVCPATTEYKTKGALAQNLVALEPGTHVASIYALGATPTAAALLRVVRASDDQVIASVDITQGTNQWERTSLTFVADSSEDYRLEILPSKAVSDLGSAENTWPNLVVSAAQVERAILENNAPAATPGTWVRTDLSRNVQDPICDELRGPAFRNRFKRRCEYVCADGIKPSCGAIDSDSVPSRCFYEANFNVRLEDIENGSLIPSGQIAIGNFNYRHNLVGLNAVGTGVASCDGQVASCYYNGFLEYTLSHAGDTIIRNYTGGSMPAKLDRGVIEHGKLLAAERTITNPPSSSDSALMETYMKHEYKGRPLQGLYTIRIWERPGLRWDHIDDLQLVWKYHYWTRFPKAKP